MTFLLSEDKALREKVQGMVVEDQKSNGDMSTRQVGVWYGQPDQEIRNQSYPYVTIDMIDVQRDPTREHRGLASPEYLNHVPSSEAVNGFFINLPIPVNIDYQITSYSRHPRHDRAIVAQLLSTKFPLRFGYLETDDGTIRRLDVMDVTKRDVTEQAKRLYVNAITVRVSSEVVQGQLTELYQVLSVKINTPPLDVEQGGRPSDPYFTPIPGSTITQ
jgi:hypothetical protein